ncbi:NADH kinase pos5, partial [Tulasnella sp. 419]
ISEKSRAPAEVSMDGQEARILKPGESIQVEASPYPIPCINRPTPPEEQGSGEGYDVVEQDGWVRDINRLLHFNASFKSSATVHVSRE